MSRAMYWRRKAYPGLLKNFPLTITPAGETKGIDTMKTYQSVLPAATAIKTQIKTSTPSLPDNTGHIGSAIRARLQRLFDNGYWYCNHCQRTTEPKESDHGQPTVCSHCGSPRIQYHKPLHLACGAELIQPGDL